MSILVCPLDGLPLVASGSTVHCNSNHSFDRAKEGYLNLLPVQAKQSKDPGDSSEMVQARRRFLASGLYNPIIDALVALIGEHDSVLDAGCGEGSYLHRIHAHQPQADYYGVDISKHAVRAAAKQNPALTWLVASNRQLPLANHSLDSIICAFGFPVWHEFKRVLKPDGVVIMVDPARQHLIELRRMLYADVPDKDVVALTPDGFTVRETQSITNTMLSVTGDTLRDLIAMTPHQHRVPQAVIDQVVAQGCVHLTLDVCVRIFQA